MDITPLVPEGRQVIEAYGDMGFRVSGYRYEGSILILPDQTIAWAVSSSDELSVESLDHVTDRSEVELLLLGLGRKTVMIPRNFRAALKEKGVAVEPMDTGAASRTYNVLQAEGRRVAAALIAVE
ncbi:MAG: Mth938-like domain-containing protein [Pseudomonadota bacterium]|uniref:Mth938-like domain-containing protein n=1 Tax=Fodinicurvata fenggangensis TaxID=1121830 RepID=UPI00047D3FD7|nr:Mth938-like domain-containing protein [Fodinicurvata fenggangensis]